MLGTANGRSILVYKTLNYQNKTCPAIRYVCNNIPQKKTTPLANITILLRLEVIIRSYLQSKLISSFKDSSNNDWWACQKIQIRSSICNKMSLRMCRMKQMDFIY